MSKRVEHMLEVCATLRDLILEEVEKNEQISVEEAKAKVDQACESVAQKHNIGKSTVLSQSTREMDLKKEELREVLIDHILSKDKLNSTLTKTICKHSTVDDDIDEIKRRLLDI